MYEQKFNFSQRPFSVCPQPEEYFPGQSHQQAIAASRSCVQRRNGPATIVGAVGTGKSLTLQVIGEIFADEFDVVSIECSRLEQRSELLQSILFGMNLPFRDMSEGELRLSLIDHLKNGKGNPNGILLLVDEADRLSIELLDELRLITNVVRDGLSQAQLVLAGTQRLEESLNDPRLASFGQRIASRSYLQNFSREEVGDYIADNIDRAGGNAEDVFDQEAIDEVARCSDGCPRVINQLCERSLAVAAIENPARVTENIVKIAWAELQNLPCPSNSPCSEDSNADCSGEVSTDSVIEFGSLDDEQVSGPDASGFNDPVDEPVDDAVPEQDEQEADLSDSQAQSDEALSFGESQVTPQANEAEGQEEISEQSEQVQEQGGVEAEGESDVPTAWSGQLPTNLGVTDYRSYGSTGAGFTAATFGGGDPFAPEGEVTPRQQFQYGGESAFESQSVSEFSSSPQVSPLLSPQVTPQGVNDVDSGAETVGSAGDNVDSPYQSFEQKQEDQEQSDSSGEEVAQNNSVDEQGDGGESLNNGPLEDESETDVRAAFDGLGLIDQARSSEGIPTLEQASVEPAVDPFAEDFEEEVLLQDAYSPFVAQQNKSSLSVTSEHLSHLQPNDEVDSTEEPNDSAPAENEAVASDLPPGFEMELEAPPTSYIPVQSVSTELRFPEPPQPFASPQPMEPQESVENQGSVGNQGSFENQGAFEPPAAVENQEPIEEIDPDLAALTSDFSFEEETPSPAAPVEGAAYPDSPASVDGALIEDGIRGQTFDMAQDVRGAIGSDLLPESEDPFFHPSAGASEQSPAYGANEVTEATPVDQPQAIQYPQQPPLDESQKVLREILAQQKIVSDNQFSPPQSSEQDVDSISVEYPITDHDNYQPPSDASNDDRDMLRVNESHYTQTPQREPDQPTPYADAEPSTGEAQRMDYSQLFDQLRNMPKQ